MRTVGKTLVVMCLGIGTTYASAEPEMQGNAYVEAGVAQLTLSTGGYSLKPSNALVRFGYSFNRNISLEGVASASVSSDTLQGVSVKVDSGYGAYLKGQIQVNPDFELFARGGWVHATVTASALGVSESSSDSGFSYGAGVQFLFTGNWYGQADYMSYYDKSGDTIKGPSISVGYRF